MHSSLSAHFFPPPSFVIFLGFAASSSSLASFFLSRFLKVHVLSSPAYAVALAKRGSQRPSGVRSGPSLPPFDFAIHRTIDEYLWLVLTCFYNHIPIGIYLSTWVDKDRQTPLLLLPVLGEEATRKTDCDWMNLLLSFHRERVIGYLSVLRQHSARVSTYTGKYLCFYRSPFVEREAVRFPRSQDGGASPVPIFPGTRSSPATEALKRLVSSFLSLLDSVFPFFFFPSFFAS